MPATQTAATPGSNPRSFAPLPLGAAIGFVIAAIIVIAIAIFTTISLQERSAAAQRFTQTLKVINQVEGLLRSMIDAETGGRGFLLTGEEAYLEPFTGAKASIPGQLDVLRGLTTGNADQSHRVEEIARLTTDSLAQTGEMIELKRASKSAEASAILRSGRGKQTMDAIRGVVAQVEADEQSQLESRQKEWSAASQFTNTLTEGGSALLLVFIVIAAVMTSRQYRASQREIWLRAGKSEFNARIIGEQRLETLGESVLSFLAGYLDARVGAIYMAEPGGVYRRFAGLALPAGSPVDAIRTGEGLLGQAAREKKPMRVTNVPREYLTVSSSLGRSDPLEILIAPAVVDGEVQALVELGFFRRIDATDVELSAIVSEALAVAVRTSKDRTRLEDLLATTQSQAEELQAQQEELRVNNEELEEQSRALRESQERLESQQVELEATNSQLEEQAQALEVQKLDLTNAQGALTERANDLERANQYKREFLANMSHELRTPLNSSLILAKLLSDNEQGNLTEEQVDFARTIHSAGNDLLFLINDILDLSRIEAGMVSLEIEDVPIRNAIDALQRTYAATTQEKGLDFTLTLDPGAPARIETDARRLGQILKNLLSNAVKFTAQGGVSLRVRALPDGRVAFDVRDTGIGIPPEQQEVIFEAFRQADGSTQRKFGGTGLGLYISRDLAKLLGGDISVQSAAGEGSVFTLTLPVSQAGRATTTNPRETAEVRRPVERQNKPKVGTADPSRKKTLPRIELKDDRDKIEPGARVILVVEDDVAFAAILRDLAHQMGFQCVITHSANDGLLAASLHHPSAIVLDVNLPDHSGLGVLDQLKHNPDTRHVPVHVVSVADYTQEALELGAIGYALKPVKRDELVDAFQRLEKKFTQSLRRVLVVEDDERQRESIRQLLGSDDVLITGVETASEALASLAKNTFDCMVMDLSLPDLSGYELLEKMASQDGVSFPPVIVYTGRALRRDEERDLRRFAKSIIIKDARSPERLLDEVTLFLHQVESTLPPERQKMLKVARDREAALEGRRVLIVEDDVRNVFALSRVLEPKGLKVEIARNGREAIDTLARSVTQADGAIDLVLMDIMMPEMDGLTAMREIRKKTEFKKLPIIALTAKAMRDDQEQCLAAGANDYIAKPLDVDKLLSLVRVWMPK